MAVVMSAFGALGIAVISAVVYPAVRSWLGGFHPARRVEILTGWLMFPALLAAMEVAAMVAANEPESPLAGAALELLNDTPKAKDGSRARPTLKADTPAMAEKPPNNAASTASRKLQSSATDRKAEEPVARPSVEITLQSDSDPEPVATVTPESIEEQFGTSMTATLKALSSAQVRDMDASANDEEDEEEKPARKLFGLFRSGN
jgi:hypothetical protein